MCYFLKVQKNYYKYTKIKISVKGLLFTVGEEQNVGVIVALNEHKDLYELEPDERLTLERSTLNVWNIECSNATPFYFLTSTPL